MSSNAGTKQEKRRRKKRAKIGVGRSDTMLQVRRDVLAPLVRREVGPEVKWRTVGRPMNSLTSTVEFYDLTTPSQGTGVNSRVGDTITARGLKFRMHAYTTNASVLTTFRLVLFAWYMDTAISAPSTTANLLDTTGTPAEEVHANLNIQSVEEEYFGVVFDKTFCIQSGGTSSLFWEFKDNFKVAGAKVRFNAGVTTGYGKFYLMQFSDAAINTPTVGWQCQLLFDDD